MTNSIQRYAVDNRRSSFDIGDSFVILVSSFGNAAAAAC
jgi:hypothetical protein